MEDMLHVQELGEGVPIVPRTYYRVLSYKMCGGHVTWHGHKQHFHSLLYLKT